MAKKRRRSRSYGNIFNSVQIPGIPRNTFDLSHYNKLTFNMGQIIPIWWDETMPGDRISVNIEQLIRFMPMTFPVMDNFSITMRAFAVPMRLLVPQEDYEEFITGGEDGKAVGKWPMSSMSTIASYCVDPVSGYESKPLVNTLPDYLGFPTAINGSPIMSDEYPSVPVSVLPFRAYQFIYNEWFRDEKLQDEIEWVRGADSPAFEELGVITQLRRIGWRKDYFTSAFTEPQLGEDVFLPMGGMLPVQLGNPSQSWDVVNPANGSVIGPLQAAADDPRGTYTMKSAGSSGPAGTSSVSLNPNGSLQVDLQDMVAPSINEMRLAFAVQRWKELNARAGVRLPEWLLAHYHVKSSDARLQRPEYLGGLRARISVGEVLQTSADTESSALGDMAGHAMSLSQGRIFNRYIEEQSIVMIVAYVMPTQPTYMNGMKRFWFKDDKFDFADPIFGNLGEQEVWNGELFVGPGMTSEQVKGRFGFQSRYAEYKFAPSEVHGEMRTSMMAWHMARSFDTLPELTGTFIEADPTDRIFNVTSKDFAKIVGNFFFDIRKTSSLPYYGTPSIV